MRTKQATRPELVIRTTELHALASMLQLAMRCTMLDAPDAIESATDDGWRYKLRAYRLTGPQGGIVVMQSKCLTNEQADGIEAIYLDDLQTRTTYEYQPNLCKAIGGLMVARQLRCNDEARS